MERPVPDTEKAKQELKRIQKLLSDVPFCKRTELEVYSPWLRKFNQESCGYIEIPGQYTGECRPNPHYHITISKFKEKVSLYLLLYSINTSSYEP